MAVYRFEGDIGADHRLEIPLDIPAGPAQIVVIPQVSVDSGWAGIKQLIFDMAAGPNHTRSKEEIDQYLRRERESWE